MKKILTLAAIVLLSLNAVAKKGTGDTGSANQKNIDQKALEVLIENSSVFYTTENEKLSGVLAKLLLDTSTSKNEISRISNSCSFDKNDDMFKCNLHVLHADNDTQADAVTESSTVIMYQLEKDEKGLPSDKPFYLTVEVIQAG